MGSTYFKNEFKGIILDDLRRYIKKDYIITIENFDTRKTAKADDLRDALEYTKKNGEKNHIVLRGYDPKTKDNVWTYDHDKYELMTDLAMFRM